VRAVVSWDNADLRGHPTLHATSQMGWQAEDVLGHYARRWKVEEFYRDAKQHLGLGRCQMRSPEGTRRHWYLVLLMYSLLRLWGAQQGSKVGSGEDGALTLGDCQRALKNEVLYDLLEFVVRRVLGDEGSLTADKRAQIGALMRELVG